MRDIFIGRQPIYDDRLNVVAYELLFRSDLQNRALFRDGDHATSQLLLNTLLEIGLDRLVGDRLAFVNCTRSFLTGRYPLPFDRDRLVLEVLEDIEVDDELIASLERFSNDGFRIALDDFVLHPQAQKLVRVADVVKLDFQALDRDLLQWHVEMLRRHPVKLLAEKIETLSEFEECRELGFDYFQGYFLSRPQVIRGRGLSSSAASTMHILSRLQDPEATLHEVECLVCQDVSLSHKLLQYINSSFTGVRRKIESVRQALALIGLERLRVMVTLIKLASIDGKPEAVTSAALARARMCERLGVELGRSDTELFFTAGLLSALDLLLDSPIDEVLDALPLTDDLKGAILYYEGALGQTVRCALAYERSDWEQVHCLSLDQSVIRDAWLKAVAWADSAFAALGTAGQRVAV